MVAAHSPVPMSGLAPSLEDESPAGQPDEEAVTQAWTHEESPSPRPGG